ncbi:ubiquitin-conjugating enzyme E2 8-like [Eutrema salsugineum]|uniref:ubiquitin-conjugating enzyme E2 8-like n=1 Tax=Eutrema salsugineum TaxID=72664 RepID=UPI000CED1655|nr:ubiquitin-conjugating enzyme E2 8-like [Eutrema salsugineum]
MQSNSVVYWEKSLMIQKKEIERVKSPLYSTCPVDGDISYWKALLFGPAGSPYENGVFLIDMHFPPQYPFKPPKVFFRTKVFHPNVGDRGDIFLWMLSTDYYSPSSTIHKVLTKIHEMLSNPELGEGEYYDKDKAKMYKEDKSGFDGRAREWTLEHIRARV